MKIYKDRECTKEIEDIHFGKVEAGKRKRLTLYMKNDVNAVLVGIEILFPDPGEEQIKIIKAPGKLNPGQISPLILEWKPPLNFRKALRTSIQIIGEEIFMA